MGNSFSDLEDLLIPFVDSFRFAGDSGGLRKYCVWYPNVLPRLRLALPALVFFEYCSDLPMPNKMSAIQRFILNIPETPTS